MAVSIKDVAKASGYTLGTVSRALNDYPDIKDETKQKILAVANELGYVPNLAARRLSDKKCQTMAIILSGFLADRGFTDELVFKLLRGACTYANDNGLEFEVYVISSEQQQQKSFEHFCAEHSLSGAMLFGLKTTDAYYESLKTTTTCCVTVDVEVEGKNTGFVGTDDEKAFEEITNEVISKGFKRIVFLNGRKQATVCERRRNGLMNALLSAGLAPEAEFYTDFNADNSKVIVSDYLKANVNEEPVAFICASDLIAIGALNAINMAGLKVGENVAVTGFDGLRIANFTYPALTTIDQNMVDKGAAAAKMLHEMIEGKENDKRLYIPYTLVKAESI